MIYFIQSGDNGPIKIGFTTRKIEKRLAALQSGNPVQLTVLVTIEGNRNIETHLHRRFARFRLGGEWFEPVKPIIDFVDNPVIDHAAIRAKTPPGPTKEGGLTICNLVPDLLRRRGVNASQFHDLLTSEENTKISWPIALELATKPIIRPTMAMGMLDKAAMALGVTLSDIAEVIYNPPSDKST